MQSKNYCQQKAEAVVLSIKNNRIQLCSPQILSPLPHDIINGQIKLKTLINLLFIVDALKIVKTQGQQSLHITQNKLKMLQIYQSCHLRINSVKKGIINTSKSIMKLQSQIRGFQRKQRRASVSFKKYQKLCKQYSRPYSSCQKKRSKLELNSYQKSEKDENMLIVNVEQKFQQETRINLSTKQLDESVEKVDNIMKQYYKNKKLLKMSTQTNIHYPQKQDNNSFPIFRNQIMRSVQSDNEEQQYSNMDKLLKQGFPIFDSQSLESLSNCSDSDDDNIPEQKKNKAQKNKFNNKQNSKGFIRQVIEKKQCLQPASNNKQLHFQSYKAILSRQNIPKTQKSVKSSIY